MNNLLALLKLFPRPIDKIKIVARWLMCPFESMEKSVPPQGTILDIGCGEGIFTIYLSIKEPKRKVIGLDLDKEKIDIALYASSNIKNIKFACRNALNWNNKIDGITLSDSLHHFSIQDQEKLFHKMKTLIRSGGTVLIKEINKDNFLRSHLSRLWDFLLYPHDQINYWSQKNLVSKLQSLGFTVEVSRKSFYFPGSTLVYVAKKI